MRHSRHWLLLGLLCLSLLTPPARPVAAQSGPEDATIEAVRAYFQLINDRRYREAWTYLDPAGALANTTTFEEWSRGYATTESLRVEYTMLGGKFDTVYVALRAVDNTPSGRTARRAISLRTTPGW